MLRPGVGVVLGTENTSFVVRRVVRLGVEHKRTKLLKDTKEARRTC
jgi:hypothetical protein